MCNHVSSRLAKGLVEELIICCSHEEHKSRSLGGRLQITMEGWSANAASIVAFCHIDAENPTYGEILDPDAHSKRRLWVYHADLATPMLIIRGNVI